MQMSPALLEALKTDISAPASGWRAVSAFVDVEGEASEDPMAPLPERHMTVIVESEKRGESLAFLLKAAGDAAPTSVTLNWRGTTFETDDAVLITRVMTLIAPTQTALEAALLAILTAEVA